MKLALCGGTPAKATNKKTKTKTRDSWILSGG